MIILYDGILSDDRQYRVIFDETSINLINHVPSSPYKPDDYTYYYNSAIYLQVVDDHYYVRQLFIFDGPTQNVKLQTYENGAWTDGNTYWFRSSSYNDNGLNGLGNHTGSASIVDGKYFYINGGPEVKTINNCIIEKFTDIDAFERYVTGRLILEYTCTLWNGNSARIDIYSEASIGTIITNTPSNTPIEYGDHRITNSGILLITGYGYSNPMPYITLIASNFYRLFVNFNDTRVQEISSDISNDGKHAKLQYDSSGNDKLIYTTKIPEMNNISSFNIITNPYNIPVTYTYSDYYSVIEYSGQLSYTWSPVSSISGKLGTLRLSQIVNINDGEPVSGATGSTKRVTPVVIPSEYKEYMDNINHMYIWMDGDTHGTEFFDTFNMYNNGQLYVWYNNVQYTINFNPYEWTYIVGLDKSVPHYDSTTYSELYKEFFTIPSKVRIDISTNQDGSVNVTYSATRPTSISPEVAPGYNIVFRNDSYYTNKVVAYTLNHTGYYDTSYFETMSDAINYIFKHYCNVDVYVDNVCWTTNVPDIFLTDESLVSVIISKVVMDETKVGVEYNVPSGSYEYVKLVYKQDEEPIDVNDGTAIDIEVGDGIVGIDGIADGNTYWFKIFTDSISSEGYEFTTTGDP